MSLNLCLNGKLTCIYLTLFSSTDSSKSSTTQGQQRLRARCRSAHQEWYSASYPTILLCSAIHTYTDGSAIRGNLGFNILSNDRDWTTNLLIRNLPLFLVPTRSTRMRAISCLNRVASTCTPHWPASTGNVWRRSYYRCLMRKTRRRSRRKGFEGQIFGRAWRI